MNTLPHLCQFRKFIHLTFFLLLTLILGYLVVNGGLAFIFSYTLTHPACQRSPIPIENVLSPETITLRTTDGLALRAWYYPPQNGSVVIAIGGLSGALGKQLPPVDFLIERGYGVLQIDTRACAHPEAAVTLGAKEVLDVEAALAYLRKLPEVRLIGAFGYSMGGVTAIRAAARYPEISAVIAEGGFFNLGDDIKGIPAPNSAFLQTIPGITLEPRFMLDVPLDRSNPGAKLLFVEHSLKKVER